MAKSSTEKKSAAAGKVAADKSAAKKPAKVQPVAKVTAPPPAPRGIELKPHQVILRPLVTEKGMHRSTRNNAYSFEVSRLATKDDVRRAVEELFNVRVLSVNTQNRKGKPRRSRFRSGHTGDWKKAIVTLDREHRIDFF